MKKTDIDPGTDTLDGADICDRAPEPEDDTEVSQQPAAKKPRKKKKATAMVASSLKRRCAVTPKAPTLVCITLGAVTSPQSLRQSRP